MTLLTTPSRIICDILPTGINSIPPCYNTFTKRWTRLGDYEELARAGAGIANNANMTIIIGGELKPGIRTPEVNAFELIIPPPENTRSLKITIKNDLFLISFYNFVSLSVESK